MFERNIADTKSISFLRALKEKLPGSLYSCFPFCCFVPIFYDIHCPLCPANTRPNLGIFG